MEYEDRKRFKFSQDYESDEEMVIRYTTYLLKLAADHSGKNLLIVSHVAAMKNLLIYLGFATHREFEGAPIKNSGYIKLRSNGTEFYIDHVFGAVRKKTSQ